MVREFRDFIMRGNVLELAVGIVLGIAFGAVVTSFVDDLISPLIGLFLGGIDFSNIFINLSGGDYETLAAAQEAGAATLNIGLFLNAVINFLIVSLVVFFIVKAYNATQAEKEEAPPTPVPTREEELLAEIRDLLARRIV